MTLSVSNHFMERFRERVDRDGDPIAFADAVSRSIDAFRTDHVRLFERVSRCGKRIFRVNLRDGRHIYVLIHMGRGRRSFITVLMPGQSYAQYSKHSPGRVLP